VAASLVKHNIPRNRQHSWDILKHVNKDILPVCVYDTSLITSAVASHLLYFCAVKLVTVYHFEFLILLAMCVGESYLYHFHYRWKNI